MKDRLKPGSRQAWPKALCQEGAPGSGNGGAGKHVGGQEELVEGRGVGVCPRLPGEGTGQDDEGSQQRGWGPPMTGLVAPELRMGVLCVYRGQQLLWDSHLHHPLP